MRLRAIVAAKHEFLRAKCGCEEHFEPRHGEVVRWWLLCAEHLSLIFRPEKLL